MQTGFFGFVKERHDNYPYEVMDVSLLQQIQITAQQVAEAISSVLGIEVTIVDDTLTRIAGTGDHKQTIGQVVAGRSLYQKVLQEKKEIIITDVTTDAQCRDCDRQPVCKQLAELCCPILIGTEVIGIIGLIAFSAEHRQEIIAKNERLLTFIRRMGELLAAKAAEADSMNRLLFMKNQLQTVLNFITEGVLAIDNTARIISINYTAETMFRVKAQDVIGFHINEVFPGSPIPDVLRDGAGFANREVNIWQQGRQHHYMINAKPMIVDGRIQGTVASLRLITSGTDITGSCRKQVIAFADILGSSAMMEGVKAQARKAAATASTVLITGESGTGKELFAQAIHGESSRGSGPFIAVNCAAIPENLLESELFGYEEGSFTGARKGGKPGKFQLANGGTLFLDEIGDMPLSLQAKMLRVLQERTVEPVGCMRVLPVDVRIIAATNRNLEQLVAAGQFREDLFYRLHVFVLEIPPLRERKEDIRELADYLLRKHAGSAGKDVSGFTDEAYGTLEQYDWPGNIRELENAVECTVIRAEGSRITKADLPLKVSCQAGERPRQAKQPVAVSPAEEMERQAITAALQLFGFTVEGKKQAAAHLGMGIATLYRKLKKYQL